MGEWKDIVAIAANCWSTVGLKADGTVVCTRESYDIGHWRDIVAIDAGCYNIIGLKADGTVLIAGNGYNDRCDVDHWRDIVAVTVADYHTVGLKTDGTLITAGAKGEDKCQVSGWKLFGSIDTLEEELKAAERKREEKRTIQARRNAGLCQHCGGELKGLFSKKCASCGRPKDY